MVKEALDYIDKNFYDLYILDINIPKVSGLEILKYIRTKDIKKCYYNNNSIFRVR